MAPNSGPASIGIAAPSDSQYSAAQLSVTVTALPTDGTVLLADGVTPVTAGETLTVLNGATAFGSTVDLGALSVRAVYTVVP